MLRALNCPNWPLLLLPPLTLSAEYRQIPFHDGAGSGRETDTLTSGGTSATTTGVRGGGGSFRTRAEAGADAAAGGGWIMGCGTGASSARVASASSAARDACRASCSILRSGVSRGEAGIPSRVGDLPCVTSEGCGEWLGVAASDTAGTADGDCDRPAGTGPTVSTGF